MENSRRDLEYLRTRFDIEVKKSKLSEATTKRYKSWIRRYLKYCKKFSSEISNDCTLEFLSSYKNRNTRRQGFYALQFFVMKVIKKNSFLELKDIDMDISKPKIRFLSWLRVRRD